MTAKEMKTMEVEVQATLDRMWDASRKVDTEGMFSVFSDVLPVGFVEVGVFFPTREATIAAFRKECSQLKCQDIDIKETKIAIIAPTVAIATQYGHFTDHYKVGSVFETDYTITFVLVKEEKGWKIILGHESCPISVEA